MKIDVLLSFAFHAQRDLNAFHASLPPGSLLMVDSGAYTAWNKGHQVALSDYKTYLQRGGWDYAITLDVIGDHTASASNTRKLHNAGLPVIPVYHFGSPITEFRALCRDTGYVAAGGMRPLQHRPKLMARYLRTLVHEAAELNAVVHALGVGGLRTIRQSGVYSADSSSVSSAPLSGQILIWDGRRIRTVSASDREALRSVADTLKKFGFPTAVLLREGKWTKDERRGIFTASLLSMSAMWEQERQRHPVPGPTRLPPAYTTAVSGPRMHNVVGLATTEWDAVFDRIGPRGFQAVTTGDNTGHLLAAAERGPRYYNSMGEGNARLIATNGPRYYNSLTTSEGADAATTPPQTPNAAPEPASGIPGGDR